MTTWSPEYVLFNDGVGNDVLALSALRNVRGLRSGAMCAYRVDDQDHGYSPLARDRSNSAARSAAAICTKDPTPTYQTMFVNVTVRPGRAYTMALYFLDWDHTTRRVGVQIVDLQTLKQLAPVQVVRDYHAGKYLIYRCDRSVRVRVNTIKKPNATLSGIFFSP